ncbi:MAG TPA: hypothetical protein VKA60_23430 [Blastocatellia bacterium]|nr:hypothetical protein [Blastocatellia bacterium]
MNAQEIAAEMRKKAYRYQRHLLAWLRQFPDAAPWKPSHPKEPDRNATHRASLSRTVARMEQRGLVERIGNVRTKRLKLTPTGREVAELLAGYQ